MSIFPISQCQPPGRSARRQSSMCRPAKRVQHDVHSLAPGRRHQVVVPVVAVRIEGAPHPHRQELLTLACAAGRRVDLGAHVPGEGDRGLPDPAHRGVYQDPLALHGDGPGESGSSTP